MRIADLVKELKITENYITEKIKSLKLCLKTTVKYGHCRDDFTRRLGG